MNADARPREHVGEIRMSPPRFSVVMFLRSTRFPCLLVRLRCAPLPFREAFHM